MWLFSSGPIGTDLVDAKGRDVVEASIPEEFGASPTRSGRFDRQVFFGAYDPDAPAANLAERLGLGVHADALDPRPDPQRRLPRLAGDRGVGERDRRRPDPCARGGRVSPRATPGREAACYAAVRSTMRAPVTVAPSADSRSRWSAVARASGDGAALASRTN